MPQLRKIFAKLLHRQPTSLEAILREVNEVMRRSEEARIHHWIKNDGRFPPSKRKPDS